MIGRLFKFHGGIKPDAHKNESAGPAIQRAPLPARLVVPLRQSPRAAATCIVEVGQKVLKGERIGEPEGFLGTAVHAPTSGTVVDIARHPMAHPSGLDTECVVIEPGGEEGIRKLADLLGREFKPLSEEHGVEKPKSVAVIDEQVCIGCTLCIQACPVDAIVGAAKQMHTVVSPLCTGCELCVAPCPVDCISMVPVAETVQTWKWKYPVVEIRKAA